MRYEQWFENAYQQYADLLLRIGRRLLQSEDEDVLYDIIQEAFLTLWQKRAQLIDHPNIGGWLVEAVKFRIMGSRAKVTRRSLHHAYSIDEENAMPIEDQRALSPEENAILRDRTEQLRELLGEENANLFLDYTLNGSTAKELSAIYGISESCVWMRISRMKKKLIQHPELFYVFAIVLSGLGPPAA